MIESANDTQKKDLYRLETDQSLYFTRWNPTFAQRGRNSRDRPFAKFLQELDNEREFLDVFLQDTESSVPSQDVMQARDFLRHALTQEPTQQQTVRAWFELRKRSTKHCTVASEWLTHEELTEFLTKQSTRGINESCSIRRLIYIPSFNKDFMTAVATTAYCNEVSALRTVLYRHIAREPTIQVIIPVIGYSRFNLLFSIPYLKLREKTSHLRQPGLANTRGKQLETDLAFLDIDSEKGGAPTRFSIQEAHATISIFGCDHFDWTGYAFSDHDPNEANNMEEDEGEEDDDDEIVNEDRFASDGLNELLDPCSSSTIWDPRMYFLRVAAIRIHIILQEYAYIVNTLDKGIQHWKKNIIYATSNTSKECDPSMQNRKSLEDTVILKAVLQELRVYLSTTTASWDDFSGVDGHINFFSDINEKDVRLALHTLRESFRTLKRLERKLSILDGHCGESTDVLTQRMAIENNELSLRNHRLIKKTHNLNLESNLVSIRTSKLSEETTRIALASQKHAEETSRTTRENVQLLLISTPFAFVLQYFCGERNFFSIDRTPKAFVLCLFVLLLALPIINCVVEWLNQYRKRLQHNILTRLGRNQPTETTDTIDQIVDPEYVRNV